VKKWFFIKLKAMKKLLLTSILAVLVASGTTVMAQEYPDEYLGLPGDNLNLYAVMKLFQESETLEAFERSLNDEKTRINNLDLNGDNFVDYIMVNDYVDGDVHTIVLRVALDRNDFQDVAVFTVQRFANGSVQIQLIGDEALYGQNYIIEPNYAETPNPGYVGKSGKNVTVNVIYTSYYEVANWPVVRFIYLPQYRIWHSSWYWGYYPTYWHPWHPFYWHYYYGYHFNWYHHYYVHYRFWHQPRYARYHEFYFAGHRSHSPKVYEQINKGSYQSTYSHPEQRRDGEALFTSLHPDQEKRTGKNTPVVSQRRSSSGQVNHSQTTGRTTTATTRRSENTAAVKSSADLSSRQSKGEVRRSTSAVKEKPASRASSDRPITEPRRPAAYVDEKPSLKAAETRRESEPVKKEGTSKVSQPSKSQQQRRAQAVTKSQSSERRAGKQQKKEESENPRR
jgi:hypothetical protein